MLLLTSDLSAMALKLTVTLTLFVAMAAKPDLSLNDATAVVGEKFQYQVGDDKFLSTYKIYRLVERGQKRMPDWLNYNVNSSILTGIPKLADLGTYTMRLRAECIDQTVTVDCQARLSRTFHIKVIQPIEAAESRGTSVVHMHVGIAPQHNTNSSRKQAPPDQPPSVENSIDHLDVHVGRYFKLKIPANTFLDKEDGDTRNLSLDVSLVDGRPLSTHSWLMFDTERQILYGLPLESDFEANNNNLVIRRFILIATDSQGQSAKDVISISYKFELEGTHKILLSFNSSNFQGTYNRSYILQVAWTIAKFYGDSDLRYFSFFQPSSDLLTRPIVWGNNSLFGSECFKKIIQENYNKIVHANDTIVTEFAALFPSDHVLSADLFFTGACFFPLTTLPVVTKSPVSETDRDKMWLEIVLPALIAILVIVIIALLLLICCRHKRPNKRVPDSEKPMFLEDRRPIIFPEELELIDPSLKPKDPLVLPSDYLVETPPAVPPHSRPTPPYRAPPMADPGTMGERESSVPPPVTPRASSRQGSSCSDPPPYRLPPPYFNPHRNS